MQSRSRKVVVRVWGGLGNQLFCYASARRLALVNDAELVVDDISGFARDRYIRQYQLDRFDIAGRRATPAERFEPFCSIRRWSSRSCNRLRPFGQRRHIRQEKSDFDPRLLTFKVKETLYIEGYWQSEGYFSDIEATIRADLRMKSPLDGANMEMAQRIAGSRSVAIHVRFFDAPGSGEGQNLQADYYARAIQRMESIQADSHYYLFSESPEQARALIPVSENRLHVVSINNSQAAYADLWLMSQCRHFIIANSTFSWWGAWLSQSEEKHVIAPGLYIRGPVTEWNFAGQIPASWIRL